MRRGETVDTYVRQVGATVNAGGIATVTGQVLSFMGLTLTGLCTAMGGAYVTEQVPGQEAWTIQRVVEIPEEGWTGTLPEEDDL